MPAQLFSISARNLRAGGSSSAITIVKRLSGTVVARTLAERLGITQWASAVEPAALALVLGAATILACLLPVWRVLRCSGIVASPSDGRATPSID